MALPALRVHSLLKLLACTTFWMLTRKQHLQKSSSQLQQSRENCQPSWNIWITQRFSSHSSKMRPRLQRRAPGPHDSDETNAQVGRWFVGEEIWFWGFRKGCEDGKAVDFLEKVLLELSGIDFPRGLIIERVHHTLASHQDGRPARAIIAKFFVFQDVSLTNPTYCQRKAEHHLEGTQDWDISWLYQGGGHSTENSGNARGCFMMRHEVCAVDSLLCSCFLGGVAVVEWPYSEWFSD